jgi:hypothetical protein
LVFEPTGVDSESLFGNPDVLRLPIEIDIARRRPLTTRMWENLFKEINEAALAADLQLFELPMSLVPYKDSRLGQDLLLRQTNRFVVTSVDRGSIEIVGSILLAAAWAFKKFIEPGWEKSQSKKGWDETVATMIDKSVPILNDQIDVRVVHKLKRFQIERVSLRPPNDKPLRLSDNTPLDTELVYDKPKQIDHLKKNIP